MVRAVCRKRVVMATSKRRILMVDNITNVRHHVRALERNEYMKKETEVAIRNIIAMDPSIRYEDAERAIRLLNGEKDGGVPEVEMMKRKDVMDLLHITRRTLDNYLERGLMDRVYAGGKKAIGVSRESFIRFTTRRVLKKEGLA